MTYEYQGNDSYLITLVVYRDCFSLGAPFDAVASVGVFDGNGELLFTQYFENPQITPVETDVDFECDQISAQACVERGRYEEVIVLPPNDLGYYVAYQRCCRNSTILNLTTPDDWGSTYQVFIPPQGLAIGNSSPVIDEFPPVGLCLNLPFELDQSAVDIDGDSLAYEFITPYHGGGPNAGLPPGDPNGPAPDPPTGPPWQTIVWGPGYNVDYQISSAPAFTYDPVTGLLSGTPDQIGQFVIGLAVKEYRNGQLLSEIRRDFQFNVVACPGVVQASFSDQNNGLYCGELTVQFENQSSNATAYQWLFGDGQTSFEENPSHTYVGPGVYDVMLITEPGGVCPDTSFSTVSIADPPQVQIEDPVLQCPEETYYVELSGEVGQVASFDWQLAPGQTASVTDQSFLDDLAFEDTGNQVISVELVDEIGCAYTELYIFNNPFFPTAAMEEVTDTCAGLGVQFQSTSAWADDLVWDFGDPGNTAGSTDDNPFHVFSAPGFYEVTLTASSPNTCPDEVTMTVPAHPVIQLSVDPPAPQCITGNSHFFEVTGNFSNAATFQWEFEQADITTSSTQSPGWVSFNAPGMNDVTVTVQDGPCTSSITLSAHIIADMELHFLTQGSGCAPYTAAFLDQSTGGGGLQYAWDFGDGSTSSTTGTVHHDYPFPGVYQASVTVESTLGCLALETYDFQPIEVYPSPQAGFLMDPPFADINEPYLSISSDALGEDGCMYQVDGFGTLDGCDLELTFEDGGQYEITQIVYTEDGCEDRLTKYFTVNGHVFYAPNAITMNSDGVNDFFRPVLRGNIVEYELTIFDRWGGVLFQTNEIDRPWVPEYGEVGMHSYRCRVRDSFNTGEIYSGTFVVIR